MTRFQIEIEFEAENQHSAEVAMANAKNAVSPLRVTSTKLYAQEFRIPTWGEVAKVNIDQPAPWVGEERL